MDSNDKAIFAELKTFTLWCLTIVITFAMPALVFLRYRFGERHHSTFYVAIFSIAIYLILFQSGYLNRLTQAGYLEPLLIYLYAFWALLLISDIQIWWRLYKRDNSVHSYESGTSWGLWYWIFPFNCFFDRAIPNFVQRVVEPFFVFILAIIAYQFDSLFGLILFFSAISMVIFEQVLWKANRNSFLNKNDARIAALDSQAEAQMMDESDESEQLEAHMVSDINRGRRSGWQ